MLDAGGPQGHATATKLTVSHAIGLLFSEGTYTSSPPCALLPRPPKPGSSAPVHAHGAELTHTCHTYILTHTGSCAVKGSHTRTHARSRHLASRMHQDRERHLPTRRTWALDRVSHTMVPMNPSTQSPAMWKHATWRRNYSILAQGGGILTSHTGVFFSYHKPES